MSMKEFSNRDWLLASTQKQNAGGPLFGILSRNRYANSMTNWDFLNRCKLSILVYRTRHISPDAAEACKSKARRRPSHRIMNQRQYVSMINEVRIAAERYVPKGFRVRKLPRIYERVSSRTPLRQIERLPEAWPS